MPTALRAVALEQGWIIPVCKSCCHTTPALYGASPTSISPHPAQRGRLQRHYGSSSSSLYLTTLRVPRGPLAGRKNASFFENLFFAFARTLTGRAHNRAVAASSRASTSFTTEEAGLIERVTGEGNESQAGGLGSSMRKLAGSNIVMDVNMGRRHLVKRCEFVKSSPRESECPKDGLPEFALVGRSNVGKSSLVNALVNRREIAQTSKTPGKTQLINHFRVNNSWYLVDLPGYGYAKAPVAVKTEWNDFTKSYFLNRKSLVAVMLLVDASIRPLKIDLDCADWLGRNKIPVTIVFTKCDRRKKRKNGGRPPDENVSEFERELQQSYAQTPPWIMTSSSTGQGKDELLMHMTRLLDFWRS